MNPNFPTNCPCPKCDKKTLEFAMRIKPYKEPDYSVVVCKKCKSRFAADPLEEEFNSKELT